MQKVENELRRMY